MKRLTMIVLVFALCMGLSSCANSGTTKNAEIDYGTSEIFTDIKIKSAVNAVLKEFKKYEGCDLQKLYYDEERSNAEVQSYMSHGRGAVNGVKEENVIVLFSDFYVDSSGRMVSLNLNQTYTRWSWVLIRDSRTGKWRVDDRGY